MKENGMLREFWKAFSGEKVSNSNNFESQRER